MVATMKNHQIIERAGGIDAVRIATKKKSRRTVEMWNAGTQPIPPTDWPAIKELCQAAGRPVSNNSLVAAFDAVTAAKEASEGKAVSA